MLKSLTFQNMNTMHGGRKKTELGSEDLKALEAGIPNLQKHIE